MKKMFATCTLLTAFLFALGANAEPVTMRNSDAVRLFSTLRGVGPGLSAVNTNRTARNINALRPTVEAFEQTQQAISLAGQAIGEKDPEKNAKINKLNADFLAISKDKITVQLVMIAVTDEEILAAKMTPDALAQFLEFLAPPDSPAQTPKK